MAFVLIGSGVWPLLANTLHKPFEFCPSHASIPKPTLSDFGSAMPKFQPVVYLAPWK